MPQLLGGGGALVCQSVGRANLLSDHFDSKQSREAVDLPFTCRRSPDLITFAFRPSEVGLFLVKLRPLYIGGTDQFGMLLLSLKRTASHLSVVFQWRVCLGVSLLAGEGQCHPNSTGLLCCQLRTDFHISVV